MAALLSGIKGKFILSINDSANIRAIFNKFNIKALTVKAKGRVGLGEDDRKELLITNFQN